uniref:Uncharacterized protein n=1 Tax=Chromera velia CCMP2878 TaxID=1169474 RepID=A0A0G4HA11_9ALVE|mmetsp:Transcript_19537/g.39339  ORF Transcript_19537/g.39339 Transcript_19537/m.39339 type:complete len:120 (-) Transcript_19537:270-629(-)|eukprot:Cvel_25553.t1-p1 / transcript=Cvel_25553.t1 / gene=Cvel_25553 / organism=Chromera_velia_CCMP2878 / gene_product=hypothetical protein / transcript_product=hypothetical protein / location=Cvel_scaffold2910:1549-2012(-) / protein_length=119 / sequence_SO=supercontig / SO=protein_coding / is_pseudo=false
MKFFFLATFLSLLTGTHGRASGFLPVSLQRDSGLLSRMRPRAPVVILVEEATETAPFTVLEAVPKQKQSKARTARRKKLGYFKKAKPLILHMQPNKGQLSFPGLFNIPSSFVPERIRHR